LQNHQGITAILNATNDASASLRQCLVKSREPDHQANDRNPRKKAAGLELRFSIRCWLVHIDVLTLQC
jgi:hypothetical protein